MESRAAREAWDWDPDPRRERSFGSRGGLVVNHPSDLSIGFASLFDHGMMKG